MFQAGTFGWLQNFDTDCRDSNCKNFSKNLGEHCESHPFLCRSKYVPSCESSLLVCEISCLISLHHYQLLGDTICRLENTWNRGCWENNLFKFTRENIHNFHPKSTKVYELATRSQSVLTCAPWGVNMGCFTGLKSHLQKYHLGVLNGLFQWLQKSTLDCFFQSSSQGELY